MKSHTRKYKTKNRKTKSRIRRGGETNPITGAMPTSEATSVAIPPPGAIPTPGAIPPPGAMPTTGTPAKQSKSWSNMLWGPPSKPGDKIVKAAKELITLSNPQMGDITNKSLKTIIDEANALQ